ncbi:aromatic acid exporter family protein [Lactococcus garvieae]|uniref:Aromatic acid exporter family protein n=1 Tax=Lactococcus garvieae TaxID=1363 RepID=A0AA46YQH8_9LACT|nr:aromatic acid exporter family protein [Lactococcus garvieae]UYT09885.1 aromatic acid exporter family protein [Lactococcus garvieae]UYT11858.1 aromatic acid exporter family protein [Lactococcus garvieae]
MNYSHIKIGQRTIKTAICATLAIIIAQFFHLESATSASIIAILSITNTQKSTLRLGFLRVLGLIIATLLAFIVLNLFNFTPLSFGIFLLLFIPISVATNTSEGIVVNSVLFSHYLLAQEITFPLVGNEFSLMFIGVGLALLANIYMPSNERLLENNLNILEKEFKNISAHLVICLNQKQDLQDLVAQCDNLLKLIDASSKVATEKSENNLLRNNTFYQRYFDMRHIQITLLKDIIMKLEEIDVESTHIAEISNIFETLSLTYAAHNDGSELLKKIENAYSHYRQMNLPQTREEFENRAGLFQVLQLLELLIQEKNTFELSQTNNAS